MDFPIERFERFCAKLTISSKELGRVPLELTAGQRYVIREIAAGLKQDVHEFVILKGRQMGISTICLALNIYWLLKYPGVQGLMVTDTDKNLELFRSHLTQYIASLPRGIRPSDGNHNRTQLLLKNESRLGYLVAGTKKSGNLGRGSAGNYLHATECSSWGDEEGYGSLMNTLAQVNPNRLYLFESTARGYNMFYEQWETAKKSKNKRAIFAGWWRHDFYRWERGSVNFKTYWDGVPTSDERVWIKEIYERYGYEVSPEQLAWWRWYVAEQSHGDELFALQEMPPTEEYAFQLSGSKYFSGERINMAYQEASRLEEPRFFKYKFGLNFVDTEFIETAEENAEVAIWEPPVQGATYVIGADPAYGSSEWADEFAIQVLRCYADRIEQVAEVGTTDWTEAQFAWVIAHLAGSYVGAMLCLEMQGPGGAVYNELSHLRNSAGMMGSTGEPGIFDVLGKMRDYFWRKQDAMGGMPSAYQWQTNAKEKVRMFSTLRNYFEREMIGMKSLDCIRQFRNIHRDGDSIGGEGRAKDDRVVALAIGVVCWNDWLLQELTVAGHTYAVAHRNPGETKVTTATERAVMKYLTAENIVWRPPK